MVEEFWKSVNIWRNCGQEYSVSFFDSRCISYPTIVRVQHQGISSIYDRQEAAGGSLR